MMTFLAIAVVMITIATILLVLPLRKKTEAATGEQEENIVILRDQLSQLDVDFAEGRIAADQLQDAQRDIEKRLLLEERAISADQAPVGTKPKRILFPALLIGISVPVCTVLLYLWIGSPIATDPLAQSQQPALTEQDIQNMVEQLATRLEKDPNNPEGWQMLARSYAAMQRFPEATKAYKKALELNPNNAQLTIDYADFLAYQNQSAKGEPMRLILRALELDPSNIKALALAGTAYYEEGQFAKAEQYWARGLKLVPPDGEVAKAFTDNIADARQAASAKKK
jgi:cytochrome c-type biogenesis protein CcmH